ncbi:MAG: helix-turn-helix transcriptional regulator [Polyangiaceae bacterium]|nr:helix-turn-helix transcriptional regulator [Polyangiaceae bacterium]
MSIVIEDVARHWNLTPMECEVVRMLIAGSPNSVIGRSLCRSVKTVEAHITKVLKKAGCQNRISLIVKAMALSSHSSGTIDMRGISLPDVRELEPVRELEAACA